MGYGSERVRDLKKSDSPLFQDLNISQKKGKIIPVFQGDHFSLKKQ